MANYTKLICLIHAGSHFLRIITSHAESFHTAVQERGTVDEEEEEEDGEL